MSRGSAVGARLLAFGSGYDSPGGSGPVRTLQRLLARAGSNPGPIDGRYGPLTERAVERFQSDHGLQVDGIAGPHTLNALSTSTPVLYPGAGYGEQAGSRAVRMLQRLLAPTGNRPGPIDGRYGPLTEGAVKRFQADHGLEVDGIAGQRTFARLLGQGHSRRRPVGTRPRPVHRRPARAPRTTNVRPTNHPTGWPAVALLVLLVGLGLVTLLSAARYTRRRHSERFVARRQTARNAKAISNGNHAATPQTTSNGQAVALQTVGNGNRGGALEREADPGLELRARQDPIRPRQASSQAEDDGDSGVAFNHAAVLEEQGDLAGAEAGYRRADQLGHAAAACNLGVLRERRGDLQGAKGAYRRADQRGDPDGAFNLGALLEGQGELEGAKAAYRRADDRGHAAAACNLGVLLEEQGDLAAAEEAYRRADHRGDAYGAFNLGALLEARHDLAGCEAALHRAEQRGPAEVANMARSALVDLRVAVAGPNGSNGYEGGGRDAR